MWRICRTCLVVSVLALAGPTALADTIYVDATASHAAQDGSLLHPFDTIQEGIDAAIPGDTVIVAEGTYYENIFIDGKDITLRSTNPEDPGVVERTVMRPRTYGSVVTFVGTETEACELAGVTVTGGFSAFGGGIFGGGTRATIRRSVIGGNRAQRSGGGLYRCNGPIADCTVAQNAAEALDFLDWGLPSGGGGLADCDGLIEGCNIISNSIDPATGRGQGGGLLGCDGPVVNCTITNNSAPSGGGAYGCMGVLFRCLVTGNEAGIGGGATACAAVMECIVQANGPGGGLSVCGSVTRSFLVGNLGWGAHNSGPVSACVVEANEGPGLSTCSYVSDCVVKGNHASNGTGGISNSRLVSGCLIMRNQSGIGGIGGVSRTDELRNCTIVENIGYWAGGLYCNAPEQIIVRNCIVWGNHGTYGEQLAIEGKPGEVRELSVSFSLVEGGKEEVFYRVAPGDQTPSVNWGPGNVTSAPLFADSNNGDYHVGPGSPCIDAADGDLAPQFDLDGNPRHDDLGIHPNKGVGNPPYVDMGAFEFQGDSPVLGDVDGDYCVNVCDLLLVRNNLGKGSPGCLPACLLNADVNRDGIVNVADLLVVRNNLGNGGGCCR